jgi:hypothetical protein
MSEVRTIKHFIGVAVLVALALAVRFLLSPHLSLNIYVHNYYFMPLLRLIGFWLLMGVAATWFAIAAYKFGRHNLTYRNR